MNKFYYTGYEIDDEPSDEESDNSDNEIEEDFTVDNKQMRKKSEKKDSKNEFELDMDSSLNNIIGNLSNQQKLDQMNVSAEEDDKFAEAVEEDTDSEEEDATGKRVTKKRQHFTNDELFYDPKMDDDDEKWINKQRVTYTNVDDHKLGKDLSNGVKPPDSDAVLNCSCCMTMLCMDCQRHESYKCQYRAMFVFNCKIDENELLKYPKNDDNYKRKFKKKKDKMLVCEDEKEYDEYKAVHCSKCNTQVAVYEFKQEIYHFFNVLASH